MLIRDTPLTLTSQYDLNKPKNRIYLKNVNQSFEQRPSHLNSSYIGLDDRS